MIAMEFYEINPADFDKRYACTVCGEPATQYIITQVNKLRTDAHPTYVCSFHAAEARQRIREKVK